MFLRNSRGQFFSPDLIVASGVFIFALALFLFSSTPIFSQAELVKDKIKSDEAGHSVMDLLVLSSGEPSNWENGSFSDINVFGLVKSNTLLDSVKVSSLIGYLNGVNYSDTKQKLGLGPYDFYLKVINSDGNELIGGGAVAANPKLSVSFQRIVYYNGTAASLVGVVSIGN